MEYVGQVAFICGTMEERTRARTYLKWLLKQRGGSVYVDDLRERTDVTIVPVPPHCVGYVTGNRGSSLRQVRRRIKNGGMRLGHAPAVPSVMCCCASIII